MQDHMDFPPDFTLTAFYKRYTAADSREQKDHQTSNKDDRDRVAKVIFDIRSLKLAPLQRERFVFLLGSRYKPEKPHYCRIVSRQYATYAENFIRANEILRELYWEALRAPTDMVNMRRNPHTREKLMKKILGKTSEERAASRKRIKAEIESHKLKMAEERKKEAEQQAEQSEKARAKRLEYAKARLKRGFFVDPSVIESGQGIEDPVMDKLQERHTLFNTKQEE